MKILLLGLSFLSVSAIEAQKKPLPANCPDLKQKMLQIKQSFSNLPKFKKDLLPGSTYIYATSITLCGVMGELELNDDGAELTFKFKSELFADDDGKLTAAFVANFRKTAKAVFGDTYEENYGKEDGEEYYEYNPYASYYPLVRIDFPFADDHCWISFHYGK